MHPLYTNAFYFSKIHPNIILPSVPHWSLSLRLYNINYFVCVSSLSCATCPAYLILLNLITLLLIFELRKVCYVVALVAYVQPMLTACREVFSAV